MRVEMILPNKKRVLRSLIVIVACVLLNGCVDEDQSSAPYDGAMVLALSWQPAFCETRPRLRECRSQTSGRYDADHFSLHGLWPQPGSNIYCGVEKDVVQTDKARRWKKLAGLGLSDALAKRLGSVMPGALSYLHRHEWIKHGTCYSNSAETYYADSLALMDTLNASSVRDLFAGAIGKPLTNRRIRKAFDDAFGKGVGNRVRVACKRDGNRSIIVELTLGLSGKIGTQPDIGALALASPKTRPGCPQGLVDRVGLQ